MSAVRCDVRSPWTPNAEEKLRGNSERTDRDAQCRVCTDERRPMRLSLDSGCLLLESTSRGGRDAELMCAHLNAMNGFHAPGRKRRVNEKFRSSIESPSDRDAQCRVCTAEVRPTFGVTSHDRCGVPRPTFGADRSYVPRSERRCGVPTMECTRKNYSVR